MTRSLALSLLGLLAPAAHAQFSFVDVTAQVGLEVPSGPTSGGIAVGDYDGDGWDDVVFFGAGIGDQAPRVFRNDGALASIGQSPRWFHDVSPWVIPDDAPPTSIGAFADLDNDGDQDLVLGRRYLDPQTLEPDYQVTGLAFLENRVDTNGRFRLVHTDPDLARYPRKTGGLAIADVDVDGDLDVVFVHNGSTTTSGGGPGHFIRNDGLPHLRNKTGVFGANLRDINRHFSAVLTDFDGDLLPDLHVAIDFYPDYHCKNLGGGAFQNVSVSAGTTNTGADMGLAVGDIENDGDLDIYSTNINAGVLYVNDGAGHFQNEAAIRGVGGWGPGTCIGWGAAFVDLDHDGDQDLVFVGYGDNVGKLYENDGTGHFTAVDPAVHGMLLRGHGLIPFDYDRDGDQDLLVLRTGQMLPSLYENQETHTSARHWLRVTLEGTTSNRDGVGARLELDLPDGRTMVRQVMNGYSFKSGPPVDAHFGLDDQASVQELRVRWPSGQVTTLGPFAADRTLHVVE
jgi:hypothetical protein